jgi:hypothetical protein
MAASVAAGDAWLSGSLPAIFASPAWRNAHSLMVVVVDQPGPGAALSTPVPLVMIASDGTLRSGYQSTRATNHYDLLSTVEASWGLQAMTANDAAAPPMSDVFQVAPSPSPSPSPPPSPSPLPTPSPGPSPVPTAAPTATPVAGGPPAPAPRPSPSPRPVGEPTASPSPGGTASAGPSAGPSAPSPRVAVTPGSNEFTVAIPVMDVADLAYAGPTTIASGTVADLAVLEFTASSLTLSSASPSTPALSMESPCTIQNGMSLAQLSTVPGTSTGSLSGSVVLYVTSIDFIYLGTPYSLSAASPPVSFPSIASGQLTGVSMVAARIAAASTSLPNLQTVAFFQC